MWDHEYRTSILLGLQRLWPAWNRRHCDELGHPPSGDWWAELRIVERGRIAHMRRDNQRRNRVLGNAKRLRVWWEPGAGAGHEWLHVHHAYWLGRLHVRSHVRWRDSVVG